QKLLSVALCVFSGGAPDGSSTPRGSCCSRAVAVRRNGIPRETPSRAERGACRARARGVLVETRPPPATRAGPRQRPAALRVRAVWIRQAALPARAHRRERARRARAARPKRARAGVETSRT